MTQEKKCREWVNTAQILKPTDSNSIIKLAPNWHRIKAWLWKKNPPFQACSLKTTAAFWKELMIRPLCEDTANTSAEKRPDINKWCCTANPWRLEAASKRHLTVLVWHQRPTVNRARAEQKKTASTYKETSRNYLLLTSFFSPSGKNSESPSPPIVAFDGK